MQSEEEECQPNYDEWTKLSANTSVAAGASAVKNHGAFARQWWAFVR